MPFASIHFIFLFLPIFILMYFVIRNRTWKNLVLVGASLVFFAWTDLIHLPILLASVLLNYCFGLLIQHLNNTEKLKASQWVRVIAVVLNLLILAFYKYLGFFGDVIASLSGMEFALKEPTLPLGISYLTFSAISYLLDVYRGAEIAEKNFLKFSAYLVMFPKLVQGPITRYKEVRSRLESPTRPLLDDVSNGIRRFIIGLAKKVLLADSLAIAASKVFGADLGKIGAGVAWFGLIAYTLMIYFDFSGYTDMALGLGQMLGFKLPENFNFPYISRSVTEFWRRWHMSLTAWFRNYVFMPLEFKRRKVKHLRQQTNILLVFLLTGLWHGAGWNFIIWGAYFGLILALEASGFEKLLKRIPRVFQHVYTIALIMLGWVFFRLSSLSDWGRFLGALFGSHGWTGLETMRSLNILFYIPVVVIAIVFCIPLFTRIRENASVRPMWVSMLLDLGSTALFILCVAYILSNGFQAFMYAQF
jgi:alginate O-acetyltransferase complex protein AlgI